MTRPSRLLVISLALALAGGAPPLLAQSTDYPRKAVRIIAPFNPGGSIDALARLLAQGLSEQWAQPVLVENRPGAEGMVGADAVAKGSPDGYTMLVALATQPIMPIFHKSVPYDLKRDFAPVMVLATTPIVLAVSSAVPATNLRELLAHCRAKAGQCSIGSAEGLTRLVGELFRASSGLQLVQVSYKGGTNLTTDLAGGHLTMGFTNMGNALAQVQGGKVRLMGVAGARRLPAFPDLPTIAESGLPGLDTDPWIALLVPAGTPPSVIARIREDSRRELLRPELQEQLGKLWMTPVASTPEALAELLERESAKWRKVALDAGISAE